MEDELPEEGAEIMLVLDSTLFMVPWAMLKGSCNPEIFSERYVVVCTYIYDMAARLLAGGGGGGKNWVTC